MTRPGAGPPQRRAVFLTFILVFLVVAVSAMAIPGVAETIDSSDRGLGTTTVAPGDTFEVEVEVVLGGAGNNLTIDDTVTPDIESSSFTEISINGQPASLETAASGAGVQGVFVAFEDQGFGAGDTVKVAYEVEIPEDAEDGQTFEFDGQVTYEDDKLTTGGPDTVTVEVDEPGPADYRLSNLDPANAGVTEGDDPIDISVDVENIGDEGGNQDLALAIIDEGNTVVESKNKANIELDPAGSETVTFDQLPVGGLEVGTYTVEVNSENDSITGTLTVEGEGEPQPAAFQLSNLDPSVTEATEGDDSIDISVDVTNTGDENGVQDLDILITNDETGSTEFSETINDFSVDAGATETTTFDSIDIGEFPPGDYTIAVSSEDATTTSTLTVSERSEDVSFALSNLDPIETTVTHGETFDVSVTVETQGDQEGTRTVELHLGEDVVDEVEVTLEGGASQTVVFEDVSTADLETGDYPYNVSTNADEQTGTLTVEAKPDPAEYQLSELTPEDGGASINISVVVDNIGDLSGDQDIELTIENETDIIYSNTVESVVIEGGQSETVIFDDLPTGEFTPDEYRVELRSANDSVTRWLWTVGGDEPASEDDALPGFGPIVAVVAMLLAALATRRAR